MLNTHSPRPAPPPPPTHAHTHTHLDNKCYLDNIANAVEGASYSKCEGKTSFQTCKPSCASSHYVINPPSNITLTCNADGSFDGANTLTCDVNSCDVNNVINAVSGADYSDCDNKTTGQTCTPQCLPGYGMSTSPSAITLACDFRGDFDGSNDLECKECTTGVQSDGTSTCTPCDFGSYATKPGTDHGTLVLTGASECSTCPSGFTSKQGAIVCNPCPAGTSPNEENDDCDICPIGTFSGIGAPHCSLCRPGTHATHIGTTECTRCEATFGAGFSSFEGSASCETCVEGYYYDSGK